MAIMSWKNCQFYIFIGTYAENGKNKEKTKELSFMDFA